MPVCRFVWDSYHSELNQVSGILVPAPRVCDVLVLSNRLGEWDLRDPDGNVGTLYRECQQEREGFDLRVAYIRRDLLVEYLRRSDQKLVWFVWGERTLHHRVLRQLAGELEDTYRNYGHIHRRWRVFDAGVGGGVSCDADGVGSR